MVLLVRSRGPERVAIVVVKYIACPYCGAIFPALTLGAVSRRISRTMFYINPLTATRVPNAAFRKTHVSNPVTCPSCGRELVVFVGVRESKWLSETRSIKEVHVVVKKKREELESLYNWPPSGVVEARTIVYYGDHVKVYKSLEGYLSTEGEEEEIVAPPLAHQPEEGGEPGPGDGIPVESHSGEVEEAPVARSIFDYVAGRARG